MLARLALGRHSPARFARRPCARGEIIILGTQKGVVITGIANGDHRETSVAENTITEINGERSPLCIRFDFLNSGSYLIDFANSETAYTAISHFH